MAFWMTLKAIARSATISCGLSTAFTARVSELRLVGAAPHVSLNRIRTELGVDPPSQWIVVFGRHIGYTTRYNKSGAGSGRVAVSLSLGECDQEAG